ENKMRRIRELGGEAIYLKGDVSNETEMAEAFGSVRQRWGSIHGVVHSALVLRDLSVMRMREEDLIQALRPKVEGLSVLAQLAAKERVDWLMVFSSIQSFGNNAGQSNYSAA